MKDKKVLTPVYGFLMGISDSIPGVSGATIALILGIYETFISSWSYVFSNLFNLKILVKSKELRFLVILYIGVLIGIFASLGFIDFLMNNYQNAVFSFFFGLIIGSIFFVCSDLFKNKLIINSKSRNVIIPLVFTILGFMLAFYVSGAKFLLLENSSLITFLSGFLAISAMIVPGISGAFVLLILNQYSYIVKAVNELNLQVLLIFIIGAIIGLAVMSRFLKWVLDKYYVLTMSFMIGLMIGGLRAPLLKIDSFIPFIIFSVVGIVTIVSIERLGHKST